MLLSKEMSDHEDQLERRRRRSALPSQAMQLQLQNVALMYRLDALILIDADGELWASASKRPEMEQLAASVAALKLTLNSTSTSQTTLHQQTISIKRFDVFQNTLFLVAQGDPKRSIAGLEHATSGIERILSGMLGEAWASRDSSLL